MNDAGPSVQDYAWPAANLEARNLDTKPFAGVRVPFGAARMFVWFAACGAGYRFLQAVTAGGNKAKPALFQGRPTDEVMCAANASMKTRTLAERLRWLGYRAWTSTVSAL